MKYDDELIKIVKNKNFKTFWHCLDYLIVAGYPTIDAFGISLQEFGESRIFSDVAFIRIEENHKIIDNRYGRSSIKVLKIGIIDSSNIHLSGLYSTYRTWISEREKIGYSDIEATCEMFEIPELNSFLMDYLLNTSKLHYGFEAFKYKIDKDFIQSNGYIASMDPANHPEGFFSIEPDIAQIRNQQRLDDLHRRFLNKISK
jgi:hypothetical protein